MSIYVKHNNNNNSKGVFVSVIIVLYDEFFKVGKNLFLFHRSLFLFSIKLTLKFNLRRDFCQKRSGTSWNYFSTQPAKENKTIVKKSSQERGNSSKDFLSSSYEKQTTSSWAVRNDVKFSARARWGALLRKKVDSIQEHLLLSP